MEILDSALKIWQVLFILGSGLVGLTLMYSRFNNLLSQHERRITDTEKIATINNKLTEEMTEIRIHLQYMRRTIDELKDMKKK
jgi:hypothetical protein